VTSVSKKSERNQNQQPSKPERAHGGYLPSVEGEGRSDMAELSAQQNPEQRSERTLLTPYRRDEM
jgi:hypothetical protein